MTYAIKEIYYTIQGEGANAGKPAVFCRFTGCNLWSGLESDRSKAICQFCDTDFVGTNGVCGGKYGTAEELAAVIHSCWCPEGHSLSTPFVVCTGGEPLLQFDGDLLDALHAIGFEVGVETNGTLIGPGGIDWLCVSPKAAAECIVTSGDELKLVYPQVEPDAQPEKFVGMQFSHYFLQPMDSEDRDVNVQATIRYCLENPHWKLSLQTHKIIGIP